MFLVDSFVYYIPPPQTRQVADDVELATNEKEMRRCNRFSEAVSQIIFVGNEVYDQGFGGNDVINKMKVNFYVLGTCMDAWKDEFAAKQVAPTSSHHKVGGRGRKMPISKHGLKPRPCLTKRFGVVFLLCVFALCSKNTILPSAHKKNSFQILHGHQKPRTPFKTSIPRSAENSPPAQSSPTQNRPAQNLPTKNLPAQPTT
jgi:hypothetical protein